MCAGPSNSGWAWHARSIVSMRHSMARRQYAWCQESRNFTTASSDRTEIRDRCVRACVCARVDLHSRCEKVADFLVVDFEEGDLDLNVVRRLLSEELRVACGLMHSHA